MHMSAKLFRRSCPIDVLGHVFKQRRVENDRSHSTGMTRSLGLHGFPSSTYTHSKIKHTKFKMKGHAYKIWGAIARSRYSPVTLQPGHATARSRYSPVTLQPGHATARSRYSPVTLQPGHATARSRYSPVTLQPGHATARSRYSPVTLQPGHATPLQSEQAGSAWLIVRLLYYFQ